MKRYESKNSFISFSESFIFRTLFLFTNKRFALRSVNRVQIYEQYARIYFSRPLDRKNFNFVKKKKGPRFIGSAIKKTPAIFVGVGWNREKRLLLIIYLRAPLSNRRFSNQTSNVFFCSVLRGSFNTRQNVRAPKARVRRTFKYEYDKLI